MAEQLAINGGERLPCVVEAPPWPPRDKDIEDELLDAFRNSNWAYVPEGLQDTLAREFCQAHGVRYGAFLSNATTALLASLIALDIGPGDEVILPAFTCPTTVMPVMLLGATPVFVDCDPNTLCLASEQVAGALTARTRAIIAVHMYTAIADLDALCEIAMRQQIALIEDCAHVPGGRWGETPVGSAGAVGCFSFQARKTITSGEGGMVITSDPVLFERIHRFVHVGKPYALQIDARAELSFLRSINASASTFQAAVVLAQFRKLDQRLEAYRRTYSLLTERLAGRGIVRLQHKGDKATRQSFFKICLIFDCGPLSRVAIDALIQAAVAEGLPLRRTYGAAYLDMRLANVMKASGWTRGACPVAEAVAMERTAIMDHWWLAAGEAGVDFICSVLERLSRNAESIPPAEGPKKKSLFSKI